MTRKEAVEGADALLKVYDERFPGGDRNGKPVDSELRPTALKAEPIKSCPSCRSDAQIYQTKSGQYAVVCDNCGMSSGHFRNENTAITQWNRRHA